MLRAKTMAGSGCLLVILITVGFILLLKSCLSKYDERSAKLPAIIVTNLSTTGNVGLDSGISDGALLFSIVAFDKTTSYSSGGGFTRKTVNTTYSIQTNDITTAKKIKERKAKKRGDIKEWPVRILGSNNNIVWIFMGELMAFDAITLDQSADSKKIELINVSLKNKFPKEARYYEFDKHANLIFFTATDGVKYQLNPVTLLASVYTKISEPDKYKKAVDSIEYLQEINRRLSDSNFKSFSVGAVKDYRGKKISLETYYLMQKKMIDYGKKMNNEAEQLRISEMRLTSLRRIEQQGNVAIGSIARINPGFRQMGINLDTAKNEWFGLYDEEELKDLSPHIYMRRAPNETARRFMVKGKTRYDNNGQALLDLSTARTFGDNRFLDGSLLLNKETATPFRINGSRYLIIHKDVIGKDGKVKLSAINEAGQRLWTAETGLKSWFDWQLRKGRLVIFGQDNPELMSDDSNVLLIINLNDGKISRYDYFTDRKSSQ